MSASAHTSAPLESEMTVCPIALAVGCRRCPIFKVCPVKTVIGDYRPPSDYAPAKATTDAKPSATPRTKAAVHTKKKGSRRRGGRAK